jgi:hypothetical protein
MKEERKECEEREREERKKVSHTPGIKESMNKTHPLNLPSS